MNGGGPKAEGCGTMFAGDAMNTVYWREIDVRFIDVTVTVA